MCHLEPGDFIIFIDKINVVDMVKDEILNRINKADVLTLEVFRRASIKSYPNIPPIVEAPVVVNRRMTISVHEESTIDRKLSSVHEESVSEKTVVYAEVKKNRLTSTESKRKQLVTFSKDEVRKYLNQFSKQHLSFLVFSQPPRRARSTHKDPSKFWGASFN